MWVARDSNNDLYLFHGKPTWESFGEWLDLSYEGGYLDGGLLSLPKDLFAEDDRLEEKPIECNLELGPSDYLWLVRQKDGTLFLCEIKSEKQEDYWGGLCEGVFTELPRDLFPEVKWEDKEPTEVRLVKRTGIKREEANWGVRVKLSDGSKGKIVTPRPDDFMGCEIMLDDGEMRWEDPENLEFAED